MDSSASAASGRARSLYFISAPVDFAMIGGLSILTFLLLRLFYTGERTGAVITLCVQLSWVVNWPHFSATSYRLYQSEENIRQYPMTALLIPWVMLAGAAASFASPALIAPCFVKLVSIWSPYHFSGQSVGISVLYARRAGFELRKAERFALSSFIYSTFIAQTVRYETGRQVFDQHGIPYPSLGLPGWVSDAAQGWMYLAGAAMLVLFALRFIKEKKLVPAIALLPAAAQYVWFAPGSYWRSFNEFVPFFHGLQYLLIAWSMQLKEKLDRNGLAPSRGYVASESARWGAMNFIGGATLFFAIPHALARLGAPLEFATGVVISAAQLHHFFVDGVIWKLRRKTVASPLMAGLEDLLGAPAGTAAQAA